jgi:hypothetical protein
VLGLHRARAIAAVAAAACSGGSGTVVILTLEEDTRFPVAGIRVQVNDEAWLTTDADGRAVFPDAHPPYTVRAFQAALFPGSGLSQARIYQDVYDLQDETESPLELLIDRVRTYDPQAPVAISGRVTGQAAEAGTKITVAASSGSHLLHEVQAGADGSFEMTVDWEGPGPRELVLRALQSDAAEPPTRYARFGSTTVTARAGEQVSGVVLAVSPIDTATVSGVVSMPAAVEPRGLLSTLWLDVQGTRLTLAGGIPAESAFGYAFPRIEGAAARLSFVTDPVRTRQGRLVLNAASSSQTRTVEVPSSGLPFDLPAPVTLVAPAEGASIGPSTVFRWDAAPGGGGKYTLWVHCAWPNTTDDTFSFRGNVEYEVETSDTQASLPAIPEVVIGDEAGCQWNVRWRDSATPTSDGRASSSEDRLATPGW